MSSPWLSSFEEVEEVNIFRNASSILQAGRSTCGHGGGGELIEWDLLTAKDLREGESVKHFMKSCRLKN